MNIKQVIKSQKIRHKLMSLGGFLPDEFMIRLQYRLLLGRWPNINKPKRFTEWIQWYKIHYRNPQMLKCVDKYEVRQYLKEKGCDMYLNKLYQVCNKAEEINFDNLPKQFVIKTTSGGGGDNVLIIKDKNTIDYSITIKKVNSWLNKNYSNISREWAYTGAVKNPRIIVEQYLENKESQFSKDIELSLGGNVYLASELIDYKFYCFNGQPAVCQLISGRYSEEHIDFYDLEWNRLDGIVGLIQNKEYKNSSHSHNKPKNLKQMIDIAKKLSEDFPYVRVDLYNIDGKIYFGELTFYPSSGYGHFKPDSFDFKLGNLFKIKPVIKYNEHIR